MHKLFTKDASESGFPPPDKDNGKLRVKRVLSTEL